jgi:hypothetical protein
MPTKGYFLRKENFLYLESAAVEKGLTESEYLNKLIENDRGGVPPKKEANIEKVVIPTSGKKGDGLHTCKNCGSVLPYFKGKCKNC